MKCFVLQEAYPLPRVDETLAQLTRATLFSKLEANSGLWQTPLAEIFRPSLLLSLHLDATVFTNCHLESPVHLIIFKEECPRSWKG